MKVRLSIRPSCGSTCEEVTLIDLGVTKEEWGEMNEAARKKCIEDYLSDLKDLKWRLESYMEIPNSSAK